MHLSLARIGTDYLRMKRASEHSRHRMPSAFRWFSHVSFATIQSGRFSESGSSV